MIYYDTDTLPLSRIYQVKTISEREKYLQDLDHNLNALILEEDLSCQASRQSFTPCSNLSSEDIVFMSASATFCLPKTEGMMGGRVRKLLGGMLNGLVYAIQLHLTRHIDCHGSKIQRNEERVLRAKLVDKRFHQIKMLTNKVSNPASKKNQCQGIF